jgi:hypothetical protein
MLVFDEPTSAMDTENALITRLEVKLAAPWCSSPTVSRCCARHPRHPARWRAHRRARGRVMMCSSHFTVATEALPMMSLTDPAETDAPMAPGLASRGAMVDSGLCT